MSYVDIPPKGCFLYSVEIPPTGGNTSFVNMYEAYNRLPEKTKQKISPVTNKFSIKIGDVDVVFSKSNV